MYWLGNALIASCAVLVALGALYFGIASCGGHVWRRQVFGAVALTFFVLALVVPSTWLSSVRSKVSFAVAVPLAYIALESAVSPLYPGPPATIADYLSLLHQALVYGPCG